MADALKKETSPLDIMRIKAREYNEATEFIGFKFYSHYVQWTCFFF